MNSSLEYFVSQKIVTQEHLAAFAFRHQYFNKRIVFTNGCFDLLHLGHLYSLHYASSFGDILIVGVNSDFSVSKLKGDERPIYKQDQRVLMLANLLMVDCVIVFDEDTPEQIIRTVRPDVLVKGGDYSKEQVVGGEFVESYGGEIIIHPLYGEYSTSSIIRILK